MHIYDWLDANEKTEDSLMKQMWRFFDFNTRPASYQYKNPDEIAGMRVFCMCEGQKYRVTGASRLGDIYLAEDLNQDIGYVPGMRVMITDCSNFEVTQE